jgi:hypothetical protein
VIRFRIHQVSDAAGTVYTRPARSAFSSDWEWLRAVHAFNDLISSLANRSFDRQLRRSLAKVAL